MRVPTKLATFGGALVVAFAVGFGIGAIAGPLDGDDPVKVETHGDEVHR